MVVEALAIKVRQQEAQEQKDAERKAWRKQKNPELEKLR